jgi:hypothetical protein
MVIVIWVSETGNEVVPKVWSPDPKESATGSQVIRGYISVIATLKCTYYLNKKIYVLLKIMLVTSLVGDMLILYNRCVIKKKLQVPSSELQPNHAMLVTFPTGLYSYLSKIFSDI